MPYDVEHDLSLLVGHIRRLGKNADGDDDTEVTFGALFADSGVANSLESLAGTLKAAKKRGVVRYKQELLLQGVSDNEVITLVADKAKDLGDNGKEEGGQESKS